MTLFVIVLLVIGSTTAALNHDGVKCGEKHCSTIEYCSSYDKSCKPCSSICNKTARNYLPQECFSDCQGEQRQFFSFAWNSVESICFGIDRGKSQVTARSLAPEYERVRVRWLYTWPPSLCRLPHTRPSMMTHPTCLPAYLLSFLSSFLLALPSSLLLRSTSHPTSLLTMWATVPFETSRSKSFENMYFRCRGKFSSSSSFVFFFSWISVYLHDERYVLLNEYEELRGKWNLLNINDL